MLDKIYDILKEGDGDPTVDNKIADAGQEAIAGQDPKAEADTAVNGKPNESDASSDKTEADTKDTEKNTEAPATGIDYEALKKENEKLFIRAIKEIEYDKMNLELPDEIPVPENLVPSSSNITDEELLRKIENADTQYNSSLVLCVTDSSTPNGGKGNVQTGDWYYMPYKNENGNEVHCIVHKNDGKIVTVRAFKSLTKDSLDKDPMFNSLFDDTLAISLGYKESHFTEDERGEIHKKIQELVKKSNPIKENEKDVICEELLEFTTIIYPLKIILNKVEGETKTEEGVK